MSIGFGRLQTFTEEIIKREVEIDRTCPKRFDGIKSESFTLTIPIHNPSIMHTEDLAYFVFALVVVIIAFFLLKKLAGCLIKSIIMLIIIAALVYVYFNYFMVV